MQEDELFIRELALLSEGKDPGCSPDEEISYFSEESPNNVSSGASNSSTVASTAMGSNKNTSPNIVSATTKPRTGTSGWGKGFLQSKPKAKTASVASKVDVVPSEGLEKLAISSTAAPAGSSQAPQQANAQPEPVSTAFSGGIFERTPPPVPSGSVQRSTGTYLGPKKRGWRKEVP